MQGLTPICPYCQQFSKQVTGKEIYPHRKDLFSLVFYSCKPCDAYVGTHKGTTQPLGRLADPTLRKAKSATHRAFDPIWKNEHMKRKAAYAWLADQLSINVKDCHIGMFDIEKCKKATIISTSKCKEIKS